MTEVETEHKTKSIADQDASFVTSLSSIKDASFVSSLGAIKDWAYIDTIRYKIGCDVLEMTVAQHKVITSLSPTQSGKVQVSYMIEDGSVHIMHGFTTKYEDKEYVCNGFKMIHPDGLVEDGKMRGKKFNTFDPISFGRAGDTVFLPFAANPRWPRKSSKDPASKDHIYAVYSHNGGNRLLICATSWIEVSYNNKCEGCMTF